MAASNSKCFEVAKAVNGVMRLHSTDQDTTSPLLTVAVILKVKVIQIMRLTMLVSTL